jgi:regulatory protein
VSRERVITDIKQQQRNSGRFSVYVDDAYAFSLSESALIASGLRAGQVLTAEEEEEHHKGSEEDKIYALAVNYVGVRPRSIAEMRGYLKRKGIDQEMAAEAISKLEQNGLLSDKSFAISWISNRQIQRPRSKRRLGQELQAKGLSRDDIDSALGDIDTDTELENLVQLIEKKRRSSQYQATDKLIGYLVRQGYSYEQTKKALARLDDQ